MASRESIGVFNDRSLDRFTNAFHRPRAPRFLHAPLCAYTASCVEKLAQIHNLWVVVSVRHPMEHVASWYHHDLKILTKAYGGPLHLHTVWRNYSFDLLADALALHSGRQAPTEASGEAVQELRRSASYFLQFAGRFQASLRHLRAVFGDRLVVVHL